MAWHRRNVFGDFKVFIEVNAFIIVHYAVNFIYFLIIIQAQYYFNFINFIYK